MEELASLVKNKAKWVRTLGEDVYNKQLNDQLGVAQGGNQGKRGWEAGAQRKAQLNDAQLYQRQAIQREMERITDMLLSLHEGHLANSPEDLMRQFGTSDHAE